MLEDLAKLIASPTGDDEPEPAADPLQFEQAVRAFRARVPMGWDVFKALVQASHEQAFVIAGVAELDLVNEVWEALDKAVASGTTFDEFKRDVGAQLEQHWGRKNPARLETIFRTNVQHAYGAGTVEMLQNPVVLKRRPFWKYSAVLDGRTTLVCEHWNGTILPADDPAWKSHQPPLHFGCRSHLLALTRTQAEAMGIAEKAPAVEALDGFGNVEKPWTPDLSKYPPELRQAYEAKEKKRT